MRRPDHPLAEPQLQPTQARRISRLGSLPRSRRRPPGTTEEGNMTPSPFWKVVRAVSLGRVVVMTIVWGIVLCAVVYAILAAIIHAL
jgi:hypothetical protein